VEAEDTREVIDITQLNTELKTTVAKIDQLRRIKKLFGFLFADFFFTFCPLDLVSDTEFVIKYHAASPSISATPPLRSIFWYCQNTRPTPKPSLLMPVNFLKKPPTDRGF
jgi:hypothetical protein